MMMKYYAKKQEIQCKLSLIKDKKRKFLQEKLSQNKGKPKELWKIIKKIGFSTQKGSHNKHMPQYEQRVDIFSKKNHKYF